MSEVTPLLRQMITAARAAGRVCRAVQQDLKETETFEKADSSPVTVADLAAQALIASRLLPDLVLVGEEDSGPLREDEVLREAVLTRLRPEWPDVTPDALYAAVDIDEEIPQEHFQAVAEVIGYVMRLRGKLPH